MELSPTWQTILFVQAIIAMLVPALGNVLALILRKFDRPRAAATVDLWTPFAQRLGMLRTAKDIVDLANDMAHVVTTKEPNAATGVTPGATATVNVDLDPNPKPGAAPAESIVLPLAGGMLFALVAFGCGGLPPEVAKGVEDLSQGVSKADEGSRDLYKFALSLCPDDACQAKLERLADPMIDGFQAIRIAWCAIKPDAEGCDAKDGAR